MSAPNYQEHPFYPDIDTVDNVPIENTTTAATTGVVTTTTVTTVEPNMLVVGILFGLIFAFSLLLCYLTIPGIYQWLRAKIPISDAVLNRRYETIEGWLISKRVRAHCDTCEKIQKQLRDPNKIPKIKLASSYDTAETVIDEYQDYGSEHGLECPVCMEHFKNDEIVSWSPCSNCDHVFHHECIKEWLVYHDNCPYCRVIFLPIDQDTNDSTNNNNATTPAVFSSNNKKGWTKNQLTELAEARSQRLRTTYFCIEEGLVTLDRSPTDDEKAAASNNNNKTTPTKNNNKGSLSPKMMKRFLHTRIKDGELADIRGRSRATMNNNNNNAIPNNEEIVIIENSNNNSSNSNTTNDNSHSNSSTQILSSSNGSSDTGLDVEMCLQQLRVISVESHC